jgi:hypothetical protein
LPFSRPPLRLRRCAARAGHVPNATIANNAASIKVPTQAGSANIYLYGTTAISAPSFSAFTDSQYAQAVDAPGYVAAELAYGTSSQNGLTLSVGNQVIGGVAVVRIRAVIFELGGLPHRSPTP